MSLYHGSPYKQLLPALRQQPIRLNDEIHFRRWLTNNFHQKIIAG
ncbi:hypothetical protein Xinn_01425 [Xenorhabdus innexi]|uniref:Transposase n=1 Tax=Xenorhabdus innexi TaxID=290109 RepID=A0A2G0NPL0_9GAMM|nr:hypothetical protein Xinn_01425 [Xenorhabdus innexi]